MLNPHSSLVGRELPPSRIPVRLRAAELELTTRCPCRCVTCGSAAGAARASELTQEEWLALVDELLAEGCRRLTLLGGEPLLSPSWETVAERAATGGLVVELLTSGAPVDRAMATRIRAAGVGSVTVSIDGLAAAHDRQRRLPDGHDAALRAIQHLVACGVPVAVTTQLNAESLPDLARLAPVLEGAGIFGWQVQLTLPIGRARGAAALLGPTDMPRVLCELRQLAARPGLRPRMADNLGYWTRDDPWLRTAPGERGRLWLGCVAGIRHLGITSDGWVKGCLALPDEWRVGSVRERSLSELWSDTGAFAPLRGPRSAAGACATCAEADVCRGGCTATAVAHAGHAGDNPCCFRLFDQLPSARARGKDPDAASDHRCRAHRSLEVLR